MHAEWATKTKTVREAHASGSLINVAANVRSAPGHTWDMLLAKEIRF